MINVAIVEDNISILKNYVEFLENFNSISVIAYSRSLHDFLSRKEVCGKTNILLLDLRLPKVSGEDAIPMIKSTYPEIKIIILTAYDDSALVDICLRRGADGYILKSSRIFEIYQAICDVSEFGAYLSPKVLSHFLHDLHVQKDPMPDGKMTKKEKEVVGYLFEGLSYKQIAQFMGISPNGVNQHLKNIYRKCMVSSRAELMSKIFNEKDHKPEAPVDKPEMGSRFKV